MSEPHYPSQEQGQGQGQQYQPAEGPPVFAPGSFSVPAGAIYTDPLVSPDYNGWWQRTIAIVKASWRQLVILQVIGAAVTLVLRGPVDILQALTSRDLTNTDTPSRNGGTIFAAFGLSIVSIVAALVVAALVTLASVHNVVTAAAGGTPAVGEALRQATRRVLPLIGWELLAALIVVGGICACVLPAIYFAAVFTVLPAVVAFERGGVIARCFRLFHGNLGVSVSRVATIAGLTLGATVIAAAIAAGIAAVLTSPASTGTGALAATNLVAGALAAVIAGAIGVLTGPMVVTAYADMRARIEPVSTPVLVQELASA
jgi:hypothetical protein